MASIPTLHKAGSAASTSKRISNSKRDHCGSASNTTSRKTPSMIPTATRRVSSSTDGSFTERSSLSTIRSPKGKQRAQDNPTEDSELIQEIKTLEGYKAKATSAEEQKTALIKEKSNLQNEVEALRTRISPLENEINSLERNLCESELRLDERERQRANETARVDGLATALKVSEAEKNTLNTNLRHAEGQLEASQAGLVELIQQLEAETAARNADSRRLQSQVDTIAQENVNLQREMQEQLAAKQKLESDLKELRSAHQLEQRQKLEVEGLYKEVLEERNDLALRCTQLDGLVESMRRFGGSLEEIKQRQHGTNTQIATLNGNREEELEQLRRDHLDVLGQYRLHIDNIREPEANYFHRINDLDGHITTLKELILQRSNESQETEATWKAALLDRLEEFIETINRTKDDTLDELRHELAKATAAMNLLCSQQSPQADRQELSPPNSPTTAISSSQATDRVGQPQFGLLRKKGERGGQPAFWTQQLGDIRPLN